MTKMQNQETEHPSKERPSRLQRMMALVLIVLGGVALAAEGKSGNAIGWIGLGMLVIGLAMFVGNLLAAIGSRHKKVSGEWNPSCFTS